MKRIIGLATVLAVLAVVGAALAGQSGKPAGAMHAHHAMAAQYMVISPHTDAECVKALDDVQAMGPKALGKWQFGCMDGDHTGYCVVSASSAEEALQSVPPSVRAKARAIKMHTFTAMELKSFHEKMHS